MSFPTCESLAYPLALRPELLRSAIYANAHAERLRWWKAYVDPTYDDQKGSAQSVSGRDKWLREEQSIEHYLAVVRSTRLMRQYLPNIGDLKTHDIVVTTLPGEIPLGDHDIVMPIGRSDIGLSGFPDARTRQVKEVIVRGEVETLQTGTLSSSGLSVTGVGTSFNSALQVGDIILAGGQKKRVAAIGSNTTLTLESDDTAPSPTWVANRWSLCSDVCRYPYVARIEALRDSTTFYRLGVDFTLGADARTIKWASSDTSPAPGARYSAVYRVWNRYLIQYDFGVIPHVHNGIEVLRSFVARLMTEDDLRR